MEVVSVSNELYDLLKGLSRQHMENACELLLGTNDTYNVTEMRDRRKDGYM